VHKPHHRDKVADHGGVLLLLLFQFLVNQTIFIVTPNEIGFPECKLLAMVGARLVKISIYVHKL